MPKRLKKTKINPWLILIIVLALALRLVGLTWAFPSNPHPDEWNMARAVSQLSFKDNLNPNFFAYGQFPLYLSYFSSGVHHFFSETSSVNITVSQATFFLRFWSAIAGGGIVFLVFKISLLLGFTASLALVSSLLAAFTPGLIQSSHFGTTESFLSFFFLAILYFSLKILQRPERKYLLWSGISLGLALGTKISAAVFALPLFFVLFICLFKAKKNKKRLMVVMSIIVVLVTALVIALITSPYLLLNFAETIRILSYEIQIARGQTPIFYTRQFINTPPVIFQLTKIFPYALGLPILLSGLVGLVLTWAKIGQSFWKKNFFPDISMQLLTLNLAFLTFFFSQAFLFCKWTRFMTPLFAFFPILTLFFLLKVKHIIKNVITQNLILFIFIIAAVFPGFVFFTLYLQPDIRFTASEWIANNIPDRTKVLYDTGNVVDLPVFSPQSKVFLSNPSYGLQSASFDFYHLDEDPELFLKLIESLENSEYLFVPSRRIFANHLRLREKYPLTTRYYELLFSGGLGFTQVAKIEPFYSKIFKDEQAEETFSVFDHPTIRIYKKNIILTKKQYEDLF